MLKELYVKDFVLIQDIHVQLDGNLTIFTGETGSGKSLLLDSLSVILGSKAATRFIAADCDSCEVTAIFDNLPDHVVELLHEQGIFFDDQLIIRRIINRSGQSKSLVNDVNVSLAFLKLLGVNLIDIHGQFDTQKIFNQSYHRELLDSMLPNKSLLQDVQSAYLAYQNAQAAYIQEENEIQRIIKEKDYLEYSLKELVELAPCVDEEQTLQQKKSILLNNKKIQDQTEKLKEFFDDNIFINGFYRAFKTIELLQQYEGDTKNLQTLSKLLEESYEKIIESKDSFDSYLHNISLDDTDIDTVEERLIKLRSVAKKHMIQPYELPDLLGRIENQLNTIALSEEKLIALRQQVEENKRDYLNKSSIISKERKDTAILLDNKINKELDYLKLPGASFKIDVLPAAEGLNGQDKVIFTVKTNQGGEFGVLHKIASGGEIARFMLAIKIIFCEADNVGTIIFDEIDVAVSGAVAAAIGNRLLVLSKKVQTTVITHSHQVASKGYQHFNIYKENVQNKVVTKLKLLSFDQRIEEIARMISGAVVTQEARATARKLLNDA